MLKAKRHQGMMTHPGWDLGGRLNVSCLGQLESTLNGKKNGFVRQQLSFIKLSSSSKQL
jgi:hypothetical protein